ncbi:MAG: glutaminyl-peptide cyclotransferase [Chitinophagaceae bacterium]|nr:glutaminyl-peptide cyclotransferase [Chitinophagaceae bacterium]
MQRVWFLIIVLLFVGCKSGKQKENPDSKKSSVKPLGFTILNTYPHDTSSYTQGLAVYNGELYEGTGNYGQSQLRKVDLKTGKALFQIPLDKNYFGEGIAILRDTLYQLTWKEKKVFVYSVKPLKKVKEYTLSGEGWGLTTDGTHLIVSDGSSKLSFHDPSTFRQIKTLDVTEDGNLVFNLNELEFIRGFIYANQYQYPYILKIDPASGQVTGKLDVSNLWQRAQQIYRYAEVPNGIAYDERNDKIYITGKWWPELYEIRISE